jgi:hypothetical protein
LPLTCGFAAPSWWIEFQPGFLSFQPIWGVLLFDMGSIAVYPRKLEFTVLIPSASNPLFLPQTAHVSEVV